VLIQKSNHPNHQTGATGVIIILIMIVLLTVGISVFTNTAQDVATTTQTEESTRVFHAAEAGIENALSQIYEAEQANTAIQEGDFTTGVDNNIIYSIAQRTTLDITVPKGDTVEIPINSVDPADSIDISWAADSEDCASGEPAALLLSMYYRSNPTLVKHFALDGCNTRGSTNNFQIAGAGSNGYKFTYQRGIPPEPKIIRIQPLFNSTQIKVEGLQDTSQYGILSRSEAATGGEEAQSILVERTLPSAPTFMNYALVSGADVVK
jgi:Tfp pilus assembly protein PilX